jgi:hypothetical protein
MDEGTVCCTEPGLTETLYIHWDSNNRFITADTDWHLTNQTSRQSGLSTKVLDSQTDLTASRDVTSDLRKGNKIRQGVKVISPGQVYSWPSVGAPTHLQVLDNQPSAFKTKRSESLELPLAASCQPPQSARTIWRGRSFVILTCHP